MRAVRASTLAAIGLAIGALAAGCGQADNSSKSRTTTANASVKPSPACNLVRARRRLGAHIPKLGMDLRNSDVDNFSGQTGPECNERQLVYWGPPAPTAGQDRAATVVKLFFTDGGSEPGQTGAASGAPAGKARLGARSVAASLFPGKDQYAVRFVSGAAIVDVIAACVAKSEKNLDPAPCDQPPTPRPALQRRALQAATTVERELRGKLNR